MLKIRLQRVGRKHEPLYRLVLTDSKNASQSGRVIEILGSYDSRQAEKAVVKGERVNYWLSKGAQLSDTAHNLALKLGVVKGAKRNVLPKKVIEAAKKPKEEPAKEAPVAPEVPEVPVAEVPPVEA